MARPNGQTSSLSSSQRSKRRVMEESMLEYYTRARQMTARDIYVDHFSTVTSMAPRIQPQFQGTYSEDAIFTRKHRYSDMISLKPLHSTTKHEHYPTKRLEEYEIPKHYSNLQGMFAITPDDVSAGRYSKNHINAQMNRVNALGQHQLAAQNVRNNFLKQESAKLQMEQLCGNSELYGDYIAHRPRGKVNPLDFQRSAPDVHRKDILIEDKQSRVFSAKGEDINDSSFISTDKKVQTDISFRKKQKLLPVANDRNNAEMQSIAHVTNKNKGSTTNILCLYSSPNFLQKHAESWYADPAPVPIRLLQRPQRAKRMDLHTPDLRVIPESGDMCVSPESLQLDREEMLSSKNVPVSNSSYININRSELENNIKPGLKRRSIHD